MTATTIEWTDETWNPTTGCTWASPGCDHCYAWRMSRRLEAMGSPEYAGLTTDKHFNGVVRMHARRLAQPLTWKKPRRVFVNSMSDLFHKEVIWDFLDQVFATFYECQWHTFQVLTKRPERAMKYLLGDPVRRIAHKAWWALHARDIENARVVTPEATEADLRSMWPLPNVWLGTSTENQEQADKRIPWLLQSPAAVRFVSAEPLLGALSLEAWPGQIDWVIVGGESGLGARPMHLDWPRSLRDQCAAAGTAFFFKQWGEWRPARSPQPGTTGRFAQSRGHGPFSESKHFPRGYLALGSYIAEHVGKKQAGRLLDGREHSEFPTSSPPKAAVGAEEGSR